MSRPCLVDANVWLALVVPRHQHHRPTREWFATLSARDAGLCRVVHLAVIRLLSNGSVMKDDVLSAAEAWSCLEELRQDERVDFLQEPPTVDSILPRLFRYRIPTRNLVNDAYLAAFAIGASMRLVTWDGGFRQFRELDAEILGQ